MHEAPILLTGATGYIGSRLLRRLGRWVGVRRIIYLGALADDADVLSLHLKSRVETGKVLRDSGADAGSRGAVR